MNGTAIILGHVPNLNECTRQYGRRFHALMDRFQNVVRWSVFSHIHAEQFQVVKDIIEHKPIMFNLIAGSVTTYQGKPPSFDIVYVDPESMLPIDVETHTFDLVHANKYDEPKWDVKYDWRKYYNISDFSPNNLQKISNDIYYDKKVCMKYRSHRRMDGPGVNSTHPFMKGKTHTPCDTDERLDLHCQTTASEYEELRTCKNQGINGFSFINFIDLIAHDWYKPKQYKK